MRLIDFYQVLTTNEDAKQAESRKKGRRGQARAQQLAGAVANRRNRRALANASRRRNRGN